MRVSRKIVFGVVAVAIIGSGLAIARLGLIAGTPGDEEITEDNNVLFVVDRSGSMYSMLPQIKGAVTQITSQMPKEAMAGLVAFDGCGADRIETLVPLAKGSGRRIANAVGSLQATGATALAEALKRVEQIMKDNMVCPRVIIFTDDDDTCGGDAVAIKERINQERGENCAEIDVITSTQDDEILDNLGELGDVHQAQTIEEIMEELQRIFERQRQRGNGSGYDPRNPNGGNPDNGGPGDGNDDDGEEERERERERERSGQGS